MPERRQCSTKFLGHKVWQINVNLNVHRIIWLLSARPDTPCQKFKTMGKSASFWSLKKKKEDIVRFWTWLIDCFARAKTNQGFVLYCCPCATVLISRFQVVSGTEVWPSFPGSFGRRHEWSKERWSSVLSTPSTETRWCVYHLSRTVIYHGNDSVSLAIQPSMDMCTS